MRYLLILTLVAVLAPAASAGEPAAQLLPELAPYKGPTLGDIDVSTVRRKVMCGYQMWFGTPQDGVSGRWVHWSGGDKVTAQTLVVDMWPDLTEYPESERFAVDGMKHADGSQACLFSSVRPAVVDLHFAWMREYGIDGVFVQRFLCGCGEPNSLRTTGTLAYARNSANRSGRAFCITYDLTGTPSDEIYDKLISDWKFLVDQVQITSDKRYLSEGGKPVLMIYGFFPDRFSAAIANRIIDFFTSDPRYGVFLIGSGAWWWRQIEESGWPEVYRRFDAYMPWNVGNTMTRDGKQMANTEPWAGDIEEAARHDMLFMPVIYPGFSWDNLMRVYNQPQNVGHPISRRGGEFFWEQWVTATRLRADTVYVAMFDEVDEGTAIFKVTNDPPVGAHFATYEGKPSDWYLRLTGRGTRMYRGSIPLEQAIPASP